MVHWIDNPHIDGFWSDEDLDRMMVFCILDRATTYAQVCKAFDVLERFQLTTRKGMRSWRVERNETYTLAWAIEGFLKGVGYRFPPQAAENIAAFAYNTVPLRTATRKEIVERVPGIGMKLASMFLRNTRGIRYAVIDIHLHHWLEEKGCDVPRADYLGREKWFLDWAESNHRDPFVLDREIWEERRR